MRVALKNIKGITQLEMDVPSAPGVYILSATNGAGKTSLLNAIAHLFDKSALKKSFQPGANGFDSFKDSQITYTDNAGNQLTYKFTNSNWHPTKQKTKYQQPSNFKNGFFLRIDQHRVIPKDDNLKRTARTACAFAADVASVLDNIDFNDLATVTIAGRRKGFVCGTRTEKFFSSGELAVIQILQKLHSAKPSSLILIDEAEISLHPSTQKKLFDHISQFTMTHNLVVLISTHSQTVIKACSSKQIYFLERNGGTVNTINPCYPSYALQAISPTEDYFSDRVFLFEDEEAILFFNELKTRKQAQVGKQMSHICIPVAGWPQTAAFLSNARKHLRKSKNQEFIAIFDKDVKISDLKKLKCHSLIEGHYSHLQLTPEVTPIEWLVSDHSVLARINSDLMQNISRNLLPSLSAPLNGKKSDEKKKAWSKFIDDYSGLTSVGIEQIKSAVYGAWIDTYVTELEAKQFFGKIF